MSNPLARLIGRPTIHPVPFVIAKLSLGVIAVAPLLQAAGVRIREPLPGMVPLAAALAIAGLVILTIALRSLGESLRVGLPQEETALKTTGIYGWSRHPIYLAALLFAVAACLYCPHPVVIVAAVLVVAIHHVIALGEEAFLEKRFGDAWREHKARVPRYAGFPRRRRTAV